MKNNKMNPLLVVLLIILGFNLLGFIFRLIFQFAVLALFAAAGYILWQKFFKKTS